MGGHAASLPLEPKLEGDIRLIADIDAVEIGAAGDVLSFEEMVIEDVAAGQIDRRSRADGVLNAGGHSLIDVKKTIVAANAVRQQVSFVLRGVGDVDS